MSLPDDPHLSFLDDPVPVTSHPTKLSLDFDFDRDRAKRGDPVHKYAEKQGVPFKVKDQDHDRLYQPAENVPIFMWPINAKKLGFRRIGHKEAEYLSVLGFDRVESDQGQGVGGKKGKKRRQGILHAWMYTCVRLATRLAMLLVQHEQHE